MFSTSFIKFKFVFAISFLFLQSVQANPLKIINRRESKTDYDDLRKSIRFLEKSSCQSSKEVWFPVGESSIVFQTNGNHIVSTSKKVAEIPKVLRHLSTKWIVFKTFYNPTLLVFGLRTEKKGEYKFLYWERGKLRVRSSQCVNSQVSSKVFILKEETLMHATTERIVFCKKKSTIHGCDFKNARRISIE